MLSGNPFVFQYFPPGQKYSVVSLDPGSGEVRPEYGIRLSAARDGSGSQEVSSSNIRNLRARTVYLKIPFDFRQARSNMSRVVSVVTIPFSNGSESLPESPKD